MMTWHKLMPEIVEGSNDDGTSLLAYSGNNTPGESDASVADMYSFDKQSQSILTLKVSFSIQKRKETVHKTVAKKNFFNESLATLQSHGSIAAFAK